MQTKKILVVGSMNMDFVLQVDTMPQVGETVLSHGLQLVPGGKGANQAYAVGKLGGSVSMLGAVGDDAYGKILCENLHSVGVNVSGVKKCPGATTGTAIICVDNHGDNSIVVNQGANALVDCSLIQQNIELLRACDLVILQLEIPLKTVEYVANLAAELGKTVILDPAPARKDLPEKLLQCVNVLKPNETELQLLTSPGDGLEQACLRLAQKGAKNIVVTLGGDGAYFYNSASGGTSFPCKQKVKVVDTTAAGDSFTAAMALSLSRDEPIKTAIDFAMQVSSIVVTRKGAQPSIPSAQEVLKFCGSAPCIQE